MGRKKAFQEGVTPLSEYQDFAARRPEFATAREIVAKSIPADIGLFEDHGRMFRMPPGEIDTPQAVMDRKYAKAVETGIRDDILERGVLHPVRMVPDGAYPPRAVGGINDKVPLLWNGQHRVAVMLRHAPDEPIPLDWDSYEGFENRRGNVKYNERIPKDPKPKAAKKTAARPVRKRLVARPE